MGLDSTRRGVKRDVNSCIVTAADEAARARWLLHACCMLCNLAFWHAPSVRPYLESAPSPSRSPAANYSRGGINVNRRRCPTIVLRIVHSAMLSYFALAKNAVSVNEVSFSGIKNRGGREGHPFLWKGVLFCGLPSHDGGPSRP